MASHRGEDETDRANESEEGPRQGVRLAWGPIIIFATQLVVLTSEVVHLLGR